MNTASGSSELVDIDRLIDERPMSTAQVLVALLCSAAMFIYGYSIQVMALAVPTLTAAWGVPAADFGFALMGVVIGISVGGAGLAPLGDRIGRRTLLVGSLLVVAVASFGTATADATLALTLWRVLTGVGIGMGIPNCNAWTAEYAPVRRRALVIVLMNSVIGVGAFCSGQLVPLLVAQYGWQGIFIAGAIASLLLTIAVYAAAAESLKFLAVRRPGDASIPRILKRIAPELDATTVRFPAAQNAPQNRSLLELLQPQFRTRSILLWVTVGLNLFTLYVLLSWLPTLLVAAGWAPDAASRGAVLIQAGGVAGGILLSLFLDRGQTLPALKLAFLLAAICLGLFLFTPSGPLWAVLLILVGAGISGGQLSLNALSTAYYPPAIKATGMSWVGVIGGIGSIIAPMAGASMIERGMASVTILALLAIPMLLALLCLYLMRREWQEY